MPIRLITNWRLQKVFKKKIIEIMSENSGWTNSEEDKAIIQRMALWLPEMTEKELPFM